MRERHFGITSILISASKDAGLIPYTQEEIAAMHAAKRIAMEGAIAARARFRHMLLGHSDIGCESEREYLLGLADKDPHPEHKFAITKCDHPEWQERYGDNKTALSWTPPNFRTEKLAA